jgi:hypothetical protein
MEVDELTDIRDAKAVDASRDVPTLGRAGQRRPLVGSFSGPCSVNIENSCHPTLFGENLAFIKVAVDRYLPL